jgi:hypothetical protein
MKNLAQQIQRNPELKDRLLDSYETDSKEVRDFLDSLKTVVVYVVPALLEAFSTKHQEINAPKYISDLMSDDSWEGTLFNDENDNLWQYLGKNKDGDPKCRLERLHVIHTLPVDFKIKWLF